MHCAKIESTQASDGCECAEQVHLPGLAGPLSRYCLHDGKTVALESDFLALPKVAKRSGSDDECEELEKRHAERLLSVRYGEHNRGPAPREPAPAVVPAVPRLASVCLQEYGRGLSPLKIVQQ